MDITAHQISQFQRCQRPYRIGLTHRVAKWRPQSLLAACMRHAIFDMSSGRPPAEVSSRAVQSFLAAASEPGLDVPHGLDNYTYAMDYTAIIRNVLEYLSRLTLLKLYEVKPVRLSDDVVWNFLSSQDESGILHRWIFEDFIPDDPMALLHSWEVFGDIAAADSPMELHIVAIGRRKASHQQSPWCRIYSHPRIANVFRFNKVSGEGLKGDWQSVYYSENQKNTPKTWVNLMETDNAIQPLIRHISIKEVSLTHRNTFNRDVLTEARAMRQIVAATDPRSLPMSRYACDHPYRCPHQDFCYSALSLDDCDTYVRSVKTQPQEIKT